MRNTTRTVTVYYEDDTGEHPIEVTLWTEAPGEARIETDLSDLPADQLEGVQQWARDLYWQAEREHYVRTSDPERVDVDGDSIPARTRSGPTMTEARHRELGKARLHVRIRAESLARLDALCAESGYTRPEQIEALIDCEKVTTPRR